jgi:hypothetical protein
MEGTMGKGVNVHVINLAPDSPGDKTCVFHKGDSLTYASGNRVFRFEYYPGGADWDYDGIRIYIEERKK